jgi:hypothetical protein
MAGKLQPFYGRDVNIVVTFVAAIVPESELH